jgi:hypothetical protein
MRAWGTPVCGACSCRTDRRPGRRETDPEWEKDIEAETKDECSKYGAVLHVHVDKDSKARSLDLPSASPWSFQRPR